jgi:hypothetical protein
MENVMKVLRTIAAVALLGAGVLVASASSSSAYVVCNRWGECWHTGYRYHYAPGLRVRFYDDNWYSRHHWRHRYRWLNAHEGRGYWRNGVWIAF